eukprot:1145124-Pelagomonas_calceolata.AAC.1
MELPGWGCAAPCLCFASHTVEYPMKRGYLGARHRVSPSPREANFERKKSTGTRRVTSSGLCLVLVMRVERILLKSVSGASKFIGALGRMSMKLQSKLGGCMSFKTKLFKKLIEAYCVLLIEEGTCAASQVVPWKGLPSRLTQGKVVSNGVSLPSIAWCLAMASAYWYPQFQRES